MSRAIEKLTDTLIDVVSIFQLVEKENHWCIVCGKANKEHTEECTFNLAYKDILERLGLEVVKDDRTK